MIDISSCWFCLRLIVAPLLLLLFKWWLVYQHDRSVCMGILGEWGRDCVELRVAQQRCPVYMRVSRTSGRFREPSRCTLNEIWWPLISSKSLHFSWERKTTQILVHSLFSGCWLLLSSKTMERAFLLCQRHNCTLWTNFRPKTFYFSTHHFSINVLGRSEYWTDQRDGKRCPFTSVFMWLTGEMSLSISNQSNSIIPCPAKWNRATEAISSFSIEMYWSESKYPFFCRTCLLSNL